MRICQWNRWVSFNVGIHELDAYADRIMEKLIDALSPGIYNFEDFLDDDGFGNSSIPLSLSLTVEAQSVDLNFVGSSDMCQVTLIVRSQWLLLLFITAFAVCCRMNLLPARACSEDLKSNQIALYFER